jgi:UDP-N-acetylglucosamine 2-epimerase
MDLTGKTMKVISCKECEPDMVIIHGDRVGSLGWSYS